MKKRRKVPFHEFEQRPKGQRSNWPLQRSERRRSWKLFLKHGANK